MESVGSVDWRLGWKAASVLGSELGVDMQRKIRKAHGTAPAKTWPLSIVAGVSVWGRLTVADKARKVKVVVI